MRRFLDITMTAVAAWLLAAPSQAATLYGVTGDGADTPETLYTLDQGDASATFVKTLGNGSDGETIAFNPNDGLLYHASGVGTQNTTEILETFDPSTLGLSGVTLSGDDYDEGRGMTYDPTNDVLLLTDSFDDLYEVTLSGSVSLIGAMDHGSKGLAFVAGTLYSIQRNDNVLHAIDPTDGSTTGSVTITVAGEAASFVRQGTGLATDPDTGVLWALLRVEVTNGDLPPNDRVLATLNPLTGEATVIGDADGFAGIAFGNAPIPEPSTALLLGFGLTGLALRRHRTPTR